MLKSVRHSTSDTIAQRRPSRRHNRPHVQPRNTYDSIAQASCSTNGPGTRDHVPKTSFGRGFKKMKSMLLIKSGHSYPDEPFEAPNQTGQHQPTYQSYYQIPEQPSSSRMPQEPSTPEDSSMRGAYMLQQAMQSEDIRPDSGPVTSWLPQLDFDPPFGGAAARAAAADANNRMKMERKDSNLASPPRERGYGRENRESGIIMSTEHSRVRGCHPRRESRIEGRSKFDVLELPVS